MVDNDNQGQDEPEETELVEAEPVEENSPVNRRQSEELERIATYSIRENGILYQISSRITNLGTVWVINAYGSAKGPLKFPKGISDEQAEHLGLSPDTQAELNATLQRAKEVGELPRVFRGQERERRPLSDLQRSLGMEV